MIIEVLGGSAGGLHKRFAAPAAPLPDFCAFIGQIEPFLAELLIIAPGSYNLKVEQ